MDKQKVNNLIECPICSAELPSTIIEKHVSKCLFFNESINEFEQGTKRNFSEGNAVMVEKQICRGDKTLLSHQHELNLSTQENNCNLKHDTNSKHVKIKESIPLSERMRPTNIVSYVGQTHILGPQSILHKLLTKTEIPNIILWGPPGCGKTSLGNVIGNICKDDSEGKYRFIKLSAAMVGVNDVKKVITVASNEFKFGRRSVIFIDEIHRFNKIQQDIFLPHIESGTIILIGATTENPSFVINSALLSRCRVIILEKLSIENLMIILKAAVNTLNGLIYNEHEKEHSNDFTQSTSVKFKIDINTIKWLAESSDGDARIALGGLELAIQSKISTTDTLINENANLISLKDIKECLKKTHMLYDKKGDQHYDMISALHKSIRASDENGSLYWLTRMLLGGENPVYIARRLVRVACEDVGLSNPKALDVAVRTMHACKMLGMPDCDILLAQCTTYLARAPKSRLVEDALRAAQHLISNQKGVQLSVPFHLRTVPTKLMNNFRYVKGYERLYKDNFELIYLPEEIKNENFFSKK